MYQNNGTIVLCPFTVQFYRETFFYSSFQLTLLKLSITLKFQVQNLSHNNFMPSLKYGSQQQTAHSGIGMRLQKYIFKIYSTVVPILISQLFANKIKCFYIHSKDDRILFLQIEKQGPLTSSWKELLKLSTPVFTFTYIIFNLLTQ